MTEEAAREFPELERVFSAYLHEDFAAEYGSPDAALRAFHDDASPAEWRRFQREAERLAVLAGEREWDDMCAVLHRLGSRWTPSSREALMTLLRDVVHFTRSDPQ